MASLVTFAKKLWKDKVGGNTPITAAELNRMEGGISDCATQINKLGDSVSRINTSMSGGRLRFEWQSSETDSSVNGLNVYVDNSKVAFIKWHTGM